MHQAIEVQQTNRSKFSQVISRYALTSFFVLSYLIMIVSVMVIYYVFPPADGRITGFGWVFFYISIWSPTISAIVIAGITEGRTGIHQVLSGFLKWKAHGWWYFAGFFLFLGPFIFGIIYKALGGVSPGNPDWSPAAFLLTLLMTLLNGPLSEEAGWRGFALPRLEAKHGAFASSMILGVLWACWHIPLYFIESRMPFFIFIILVLVITTLMTWVYNNTKGSLLMTVICHFSFNLVGAVITGTTDGGLGLLPMNTFYIAGSVLIGLYVIAVVAIEGPKKLSRKPDTQMPFKR